MEGMRRVPPALVLFLLAPIVAEVLVGDIPFSVIGLVALVFVAPIYGAGAVLIRDLVRRTGRGWGSILLLGAAYCIVEEGIGLQSLFNPHIYGGLGPYWGARVLGVNGAYLLVQLVNHSVWSVAIPILLTELLYPDRRDAPFLGKVGLALIAVVYVLGIGLVVVSAQTSIAPGYWAPSALLVASVVAVVVLGVIALGVLPRRAPRPPRAGAKAPPAWAPLALGAVGGFMSLALIFFPGHDHLPLMRTPLVVLPLLGTVAVVAVAAWLVRRWTSGEGWSDTQSVALAAGALTGHTAAGFIISAHRAELGVLLLVMVALLAVLGIRVAQRRPERLTGG